MNDTNELVLRPFADAYNSYLEALHEAMRETLAQAEEAHLSYVELVREVYTDSQQRAEEAPRRYISAIKEAQSSEDAAQKIEEIYRDYSEALKNAFSVDDSIKLFEGQRDLTQALEEAWDLQKVQHQFEIAFSNYLRALQDAWAETDVDVVDSYSLATIGQSLIAAAGLAASTLPQCGIGRAASESKPVGSKKLAGSKKKESRDETSATSAASEGK